MMEAQCVIIGLADTVDDLVSENSGLQIDRPTS